jgi:hypothetical protein
VNNEAIRHIVLPVLLCAVLPPARAAEAQAPVTLTRARDRRSIINYGATLDAGAHS